MRRTGELDAMLDAALRDRAVRGDVIGIGFRHALEHGPADLHGVREVFALDAPCAVVARAALDGVDARVRNPLERLARLLARVLHARVTWDVIADLAERLLEIL